jgi:hypothetical protein
MLKSSIHNPFDAEVFGALPLHVLSELVTEIKKAYQGSAMDVLFNAEVPEGSGKEHFPQERRFRVQQAIIKIATKHTEFLTYREQKTKPRGGRFVTLRAGRLVLVEKFLQTPYRLPVPKYISYLTAQPNFFEPEIHHQDDIFAVLVHGYDKKSILLEAPDYIDIVFPDPVDPANIKAVLHRIPLLDLDFTISEVKSPVKIPEVEVTLKDEVEFLDIDDVERGELN